VTRAWIVAGLLALGSAARADAQQKIKPQATVEVLDDKAQIDDVISRIHNETPQQSGSLKTDRPPPPPIDKQLKKTGDKPPPPLRRPHHEPGSSSTESTQRTQHRK
jgi:hypothetical protein